MQLVPDWHKHTTPEAFELEFNLKFTGPGFYLSATDTLLLMPLPPHTAATRRTVWNVKQPKDTIYHCHVYNVNFAQTVFSVIAIAPVRTDSR